MAWILAAVTLLTIVYMLRFYRLRANLKEQIKELKEIEQNPEDNRILHISFPDKEAERFLEAMNDYILLTRKERIFYKKREKELRAQIEDISHDLRTPLTAIIGYLELMDLEGMDGENREMLAAILKKARSLQNLVGNFYDLSRLEMNDYHLHLEKLEILRFAKENALLFYQEFEKRGLAVEFGAGWESESTAYFIQADRGAMERIFNNMLQNALRYAKSFLHIDIFRENEQVCILFENDTEGMKAEDAAHLFERFYVQEKSRTSQSTGLGLTINKLLTEAMGGSVEACMKEDRLQILYRFKE